MFKILHTADWHLDTTTGTHSSPAKIISTVLKTAIKFNTQYVLCVGDIFNKPNPDQKVKDSLIRQISKCLSTVPELQCIFVTGNHDYTTKDKTYHSLRYLRIIENIINAHTNTKCRFTVVEPGQYTAYPDFNLFVMAEWGKLHNITTANQIDTKPLILAWHGIVPGFNLSTMSGSAASLAIKDILHKTGAGYIALGDIHQCMELHPRCWYSGPPVQKAYNDIDGVLVVTLDKKITVAKYRLDLPKKLTLPLDFTEGKDSEKTIIEFVKEKTAPGNLVKLKFELPLQLWATINRDYIRAELQEHCLELVFENDPILEKRARKSIEKMSEATTFEQEIDVVLSEEDFGLNKKKLKAHCLEYL